MSTIAAYDAHVFQQARKSLRTLVSAGDNGASGRVLFAELWGVSWTRKLMRRLTEGGLVRAVGGARGHHGDRMYYPTDRLASVALDDIVLGELLWPRANVLPDVTGEEPTEPAEKQSSGLSESLATDEAVLKISSAILENIVYVRGQLVDVQKQLKELRKVWE